MLAADWDALTDLHCAICGPEPAYYTKPDHPWPLVWLHEHCKPEHERRQREASCLMHDIEIDEPKVNLSDRLF